MSKQRIPSPKPGTLIGKWTVIKEVERKIFPSGQRHRMVRVQCECGKKSDVMLNALRRRDTLACRLCCWDANRRVVFVAGRYVLLSDLLREHGVNRDCYDKRRERGMDLIEAATKPMRAHVCKPKRSPSSPRTARARPARRGHPKKT